MKLKVMTLCVVYQKPRVLLAMKKRGFGSGRWNGYGGKPKNGEAIHEAAVREMREESGATPLNIQKAGTAKFFFKSEPGVVRECHIFSTPEYEGELMETEEMRPRWFNEGIMPYDDMWAADEYWFPYLFRGEKFAGDFFYDSPESNKLLSRSVHTVSF